MLIDIFPSPYVEGKNRIFPVALSARHAAFRQPACVSRNTFGTLFLCSMQQLILPQIANYVYFCGRSRRLKLQLEGICRCQHSGGIIIPVHQPLCIQTKLSICTCSRRSICERNGYMMSELQDPWAADGPTIRTSHVILLYSIPGEHSIVPKVERKRCTGVFDGWRGLWAQG